MNRAMPEMLHCLNIPGNVSGNCTDMTVLERQRARMKWQEHGQDQSYYCGSEFALPIDGNQVQNFQAIKPDPGLDLEYGWPDLGTAVFGSCGYGNASAYDLNSAILRTASCPPAVAAAAVNRNVSVASDKVNSGVGSESFKKRKAEKLQNRKVVTEDESKDKKLKGCAEDGDSKITEQTSADTSKDNSKAYVVQKTDYIHVRARRGQATDSHSLAERVRREKISERMKYLQDLVPGCNKITGKAGMLDEIINYVQSLQRQVEFLSMKLATVNPTLDFNLDNLFVKEAYPSCSTSFPAVGILTELTNPSYLHFTSAQQMVSCCGIEMGIDPPDMGIRRTLSAPVSIPQPFVDSSTFPQIQTSSVWDADLQNFCNVQFNPERSSAFPSQHFTDSVEGCSLKMEM